MAEGVEGVIAKLLMAITMALTALGTPGVTTDVIPAGDHYLMVDDAGYLTMWEETNGIPGLQPARVVILGQIVSDNDHMVHL